MKGGDSLDAPLALVKPDGSKLTRIEMEQQIRTTLKSAMAKRNKAVKDYGLPQKEGLSMKLISLIHWLLDAMIDRGEIEGQKIGIVPSEEADPQFELAFAQRLIAFVQAGWALQPNKGEGIDMSQNPPYPPPPPNGAPAAYPPPPPPVPQSYAAPPQGQAFQPPPPPQAFTPPAPPAPPQSYAAPPPPQGPPPQYQQPQAYPSAPPPPQAFQPPPPPQAPQQFQPPPPPQQGFPQAPPPPAPPAAPQQAAAPQPTARKPRAPKATAPTTQAPPMQQLPMPMAPPQMQQAPQAPAAPVYQQPAAAPAQSDGVLLAEVQALREELRQSREDFQRLEWALIYDMRTRINKPGNLSAQSFLEDVGLLQKSPQ